MAQYVGVLDSPWSKVAESIESLWHNSVKTEHGVEEVIRTLDVKLSEAIMHAMENGPELEKKVSLQKKGLVFDCEKYNKRYK